MNLTALAVAAAVALAGCSVLAPAQAPVPASAPQLSGIPATGLPISGNGYSFTAPVNWDKPKSMATPAGVDVFAADLTDTDGFADNVNVVLSPAGKVTPDQVESAGVKELKDVGAGVVTKRDRVTIAGSVSAHLSAGFDTGGVKYQIEQFYLTRGKQTYVVTFSFSPSVSITDRDAVAGSVLTTWIWK